VAPDKLKNDAQCCFSKFDCRLFISNFFQFAFYLSPSLSVVSTSLAQHCCKCCNHSVNVVLNVRFTINAMCVKNNSHIYVVQTSRNRMSTTCDLNAATMWSFAPVLLRLSNCNKVARMWRWCQVQFDPTTLDITDFENPHSTRFTLQELLLLQPLLCRCVECVIHHERDVR